MNHVPGSVTQLEIAAKTGLDVSTCCKILNQVRGPVFRQETIDLVMRTAKSMGYRFHRPSKRALIDMIRKLVGRLDLVQPQPDRATLHLSREAKELVAMAEPAKKEKKEKKA
jgi:DNA-binding LacI/PurR family transcriptional regulator